MISGTNSRRWLAAAIVAVAGAAVFQCFGNANHGYIDTNSLFWWWTYQWVNPASETQHGWLILAISVWLWWTNLRSAGAGVERPSVLAPDGEVRGERQVQARPYGTALAALIAGLALHAVGFMAQQARLSIIALLVFAWGVLRLGGGPRWGAAARFPLAFLVFAIPVNALDSVGFWLRLWVIETGTWLAHHVGIAVVESGTQLFAPDGRYNYDVAAACSGVRSLMALSALALLIGYLMFRSWWRRVIILLFCFPLVYLGNLVRILAIIVAAHLGGQRWGEGAHGVMGWGVFVIVLGGVWGAALLLRRRAPESGSDVSVDLGRTTPETGLSSRVGRSSSETNPTTNQVRQDGELGPPGMAQRGPALVAGIVVLLAVVEMVFLHHVAVMPPRGETGVVLTADGRNPAELPTFAGPGWVGRPALVTTIERQILPPDTGFSRMDYVSPRDSRHVFLSIVLSGRDRTSIHRPELCLLGQGWTTTGRGFHTFAYPGHPESGFPATLLHVRREAPISGGGAVAPQLVAYWFVGGDTVVASHWSRLARDAWNRVVHARVDRWAYVLMQTDAADGEAAALVRMQAVLEATLPSFQRPMTGASPESMPVGRSQ